MAGFINSGMNGQRKGYDLYKIRDASYLGILSKAIYRFELVKPFLTFQTPDGMLAQPGKSFETDMGSVPKMMQVFIPKDRYLGYYLHDFACRYGYLWVSCDDGKTWQKAQYTRAEADTLLRVMCQYDPNPGNALSRWSVYFGVRVGALFMGKLPKIPPEEPRWPVALA